MNHLHRRVSRVVAGAGEISESVGLDGASIKPGIKVRPLDADPTLLRVGHLDVPQAAAEHASDGAFRNAEVSSDGCDVTICGWVSDFRPPDQGPEGKPPDPT